MASATIVYEFEWDPEKARTNHRKHGVAFEEAATGSVLVWVNGKE